MTTSASPSLFIFHDPPTSSSSRKTSLSLAGSALSDPVLITIGAQDPEMLPGSDDSDEAIPEEYLPVIIRYLEEYSNVSIDFSKPHVNPHFAISYPLIILVYSLLILSSVVANLAMIFHIIKHRLYRDATCAFLINIAIASTIHVVFVLPITLAVMLMQNWLFGKFICFCLPMFQDIPIHISMLTYLMIAGDRYRYLSDPRKPRIPAFVCSLGAWFFAICIVLPYPIYSTYLDFQNFSEAEHGKPSTRGLQMCMANLENDIQEYMRSLFIGTYVAPLTITAYFYVKSGQELQNQEIPYAVAMYKARTQNSTAYSRQGSSASNDLELNIQSRRENESSGTSGTVAISNLSNSCDLDDSELDVHKEKRTQKYIMLMTTAFATCLCPLMILRLAKTAIPETYENSAHINWTFVTFVWIAFCPAFITPCFYAFWQLSRAAKERLRGYFRFSSRRHTRISQEYNRRSIERLHRHSRLKLNSIPGGTPRSRADSGVSGSSCAADESNIPRLPRSLDSPSRNSDVSVTNISFYKKNFLP